MKAGAKECVKVHVGHQARKAELYDVPESYCLDLLVPRSLAGFLDSILSTFNIQWP